MASRMTSEQVHGIVCRNRYDTEKMVAENISRIDKEIEDAIIAAYEYPIIVNVDLTTENDKIAWRFLMSKYNEIFGDKVHVAFTDKKVSGWFRLEKQITNP